jgi:hypothetical protein
MQLRLSPTANARFGLSFLSGKLRVKLEPMTVAWPRAGHYLSEHDHRLSRIGTTESSANGVTYPQTWFLKHATGPDTLIEQTLGVLR